MQIPWLNQEVLQGQGSEFSEIVRGDGGIYAGTSGDLCRFLG